MPLYDMQCKECNHTFEELAKYNEIIECPECKSLNTIKLITNVVNWNPASCVLTNKNWDWVNRQVELDVKNNDDIKK